MKERVIYDMFCNYLVTITYKLIFGNPGTFVVDSKKYFILTDAGGETNRKCRTMAREADLTKQQANKRKRLLLLFFPSLSLSLFSLSFSVCLSLSLFLSLSPCRLTTVG
jgi:hypothetical protein